MIEEAHRTGDCSGLSVWNHDQAGPSQTVPYPGRSWRPRRQPARQPSQYVRNGTAKVLTLFHPASGRILVKGVTRCPNSVLHPWLKDQLSSVLASLPQPSAVATQDSDARRAEWERWQEGLSHTFTLPRELPPLRMLLILDNLPGHKTPHFVLWLLEHGIMPLYTPLNRSWLNMAESVQRILKRRALDGQYPHTRQEIIDWFEATAVGWNRQPTPFEWGGKRAARRDRARRRRHRLGGSGACTHRAIPRRATIIEQWRHSCQTTH